jgi:hypothetical protein
LSVKVDVVAVEVPRQRAIERSAEHLLNCVLKARDAEVIPEPRNDVWNLRETVWPALDLPECRGILPQQVRLTLLPLNRIGQMEGKSGSLVLIGCFSATELGDLHSHPLVVKTRDRSKPDPERLEQEYKNACAVKPFAYDSKDSFAIPIYFDDRQDDFFVLWSICSLSDPIWPQDDPPTNPVERFRIVDLRDPLKEARNEEVGKTLDEVFNLLRNCHCRFNRHKTQELVVGEEYGWYLRGFGHSQVPETVWGSPPLPGTHRR